MNAAYEAKGILKARGAALSCGLANVVKRDTGGG